MFIQPSTFYPVLEPLSTVYPYQSSSLEQPLSTLYSTFNPLPTGPPASVNFDPLFIRHSTLYLTVLFSPPASINCFFILCLPSI